MLARWRPDVWPRPEGRWEKLGLEMAVVREGWRRRRRRHVQPTFVHVVFIKFDYKRKAVCTICSIKQNYGVKIFHKSGVLHPFIKCAASQPNECSSAIVRLSITGEFRLPR